MQHLFYNPELKQRYIESNPSAKNASGVFKKIKKYEDEIGCDLAEMSRDQIISIMNSLDYTEPNSAKNDVYAINAYKRWCCNVEVAGSQECVPPLNPKADIDFVSAIRKKFYRSFDEIYDELCGFYDFKNGDEAAPAICLSWLGFSLTQICELKTHEVDFAQRKIYDENGSELVIDIDQRIISILKDYNDVAIATRKQHWEYVVYSLESGYFMHKMVSQNSKKTLGKVERKQIAKKITEAAELSRQTYRIDSKLFLPNIAKSGDLYRVYRLEQSGVDIRNSNNKELVQKAYGSSGIQFADVIFQYECYKKAFNLE